MYRRRRKTFKILLQSQNFMNEQISKLQLENAKIAKSERNLILNKNVI